MPQMGESVTEGTVLEWHKQEGEYVSEGETVVEVSTDKIDAEVPAPASGVITKILVSPDDTVQIGQALAELDTSAEPSGNGAPRRTAAASSASPGPASGPTGEGDADLGDENAPRTRPSPGRDDRHACRGTGARRPRSAARAVAFRSRCPRWASPSPRGPCSNGTWPRAQRCQRGRHRVEVSTDKVDAEVPAPASGVITKLLVSPDDTVQIGQALAEMTAGAAPCRRAPAAAEAPRRPRGTGRRRGRRSRLPRGAPRRGGERSRSGRRPRLGPGRQGDQGRRPGGSERRRRRGEPAPQPDRCSPPGETKPLRGPAAMLAQAMNESRSVPTATSFRTLPVDVLDAKRRALNGALKERGMKVSFTHLVAWAIVKAAQDWPVMGRSYAEEDGKPQVIEAGLHQPRHRGRRGAKGRLAQPDGPLHQGRRTALDFTGFHSYYEDLITKTRENKLTADDFQSTNITLTNPGRPRHRRLRPAPADGPGDDRRHRLDRLPGRVGPRPRRQDQGARHLEGHDDDLDLRPPHHPGRRVGVVPAPDRPAAPGGGRLLRVGRRVARHRGQRRHQRLSGLGLRIGPSSRRRRAGARRRGSARHRTAPGGAGRHLAAQGVPDPRPPGRSPRPPGLRAATGTRRSSRRTSTSRRS